MEMRPTNSELVRRMQGRVKWFCQSRGYGFVEAPEIAEDILLHQNTLTRNGQSSIVADAQVDVFVRQTPQGLQVTELINIVKPDEPENNACATHSASDFVPARVKWYDEKKGFGFVNRFGDPEDCFVHERQLGQAGLGGLGSGEAVCVVVEESHRGAVVLAVRTWSQIGEDKGATKQGGQWVQ